MTQRRVQFATVFLAIGLLAAFVAVQMRFTKGQAAAPLDDAWIHFQFARNLVQGNGFSFNAGVPTPGSTAPLWTLLMAVPALFTEQLMVPGLVISALFFLWSGVADGRAGV